MFNAIQTAGTGLSTYHTWLSVIADNIANSGDNTTTSSEAFQQHYVHAAELGQTDDQSIGSGVKVTSIAAGSGEGELVHDPSSPLADANGDYRRANVDLAQQMGDMMVAQRAFQANANVVDTTKSIYQAAISIGKGI